MKFLSALSVIVIIIVGLRVEQRSSLTTGDISFVDFDTRKEGFSIKALNHILPKTKIHFTDSEWNGNRFGADENDIIWETGNDTIKKGTIIHFSSLDIDPVASRGHIQNTMSLSKEREAVFAYKGSSRLPTKFIAAAANDSMGFGTLINTGLGPQHVTLFYK